MSATSFDWTVHEAREVCRSSRGYGSVSAFCGWGNGGSGDREPNVAANTLSALLLNSKAVGTPEVSR
jgi:hypothetical protein